MRRRPAATGIIIVNQTQMFLTTRVYTVLSTDRVVQSECFLCRCVRVGVMTGTGTSGWCGRDEYDDFTIEFGDSRQYISLMRVRSGATATTSIRSRRFNGRCTFVAGWCGTTHTGRASTGIGNQYLLDVL